MKFLKKSIKKKSKNKKLELTCETNNRDHVTR